MDSTSLRRKDHRTPNTKHQTMEPRPSGRCSLYLPGIIVYVKSVNGKKNLRHEAIESDIRTIVQFRLVTSLLVMNTLLYEFQHHQRYHYRYLRRHSNDLHSSWRRKNLYTARVDHLRQYLHSQHPIRLRKNNQLHDAKSLQEPVLPNMIPFNFLLLQFSSPNRSLLGFIT